MRKLNYFIVGLSQLIMGTMTIGFVSCEQNLEALDNSPPNGRGHGWFEINYIK